MVEKPFKAYENFPTEKKYFPSREISFSQLGKIFRLIALRRRV